MAAPPATAAAPARPEPLPLASHGATHRVEPGETLHSIARWYGVTVEELVRLNQIEDPAKLQAGTRLVLSDGEPSVDVAARPPASVLVSSLGKLEPVDEAARDPSFERFRERLREACARHDWEFLASVLDPYVVTRAGAEGVGVEAFERMWRPRDPGSALWSALADVLSRGGAFRESRTQRHFCAPYVYTNFPSELDADRYAVVLGEDVRLRATPQGDGEILGLLSYDLVELVEPRELGNDPDRWVPVRLPSGPDGYVARQWIRTPNDLRACFQQSDGRWALWLLGSR